MSVRTKGRRKIVVNEKIYVWYVKLDDESPYYILHIVSEDKKLIISCPLRTKTVYIISKGTVFQGKRTDGRWKRYLLPFDIPEMITPGFVSEVILWALQGEETAQAAWNINNVPV